MLDEIPKVSMCCQGLPDMNMSKPTLPVDPNLSNKVAFKTWKMASKKYEDRLELCEDLDGLRRLWWTRSWKWSKLV